MGWNDTRTVFCDSATQTAHYPSIGLPQAELCYDTTFGSCCEKPFCPAGACIQALRRECEGCLSSALGFDKIVEEVYDFEERIQEPAPTPLEDFQCFWKR